MLSLKKGQKIYLKDRDYAYELLEDSCEMSGGKQGLFIAKAKKAAISEGGQRSSFKEGEELFIKYTSVRSSHSGWLSSESKFCMHYPYIARVYGGTYGKIKIEDTEKEESVFVLEEEWLEGMNLMHFIDMERRGRKDKKKEQEYEDHIFSFFLQLLYAANYYSKADPYAETGSVRVKKDIYIHRDIKPENIMIVERDGKQYAILIDFDMAHIVGSSETNRHFANQDQSHSNNPQDYSGIGGTDFTADPRAWGPMNLDIQADIYSMGRTFCECLLSERWVSRDLNGRYFTVNETKLIKSKMMELKAVKAAGKKLPKDADKSFYPAEWLKMAYGVDMERLDAKYKDARYKKLISIICNMVAPLKYRYGDFETILKHMKEFLKEYYGEEQFKAMKICDQLLCGEQEQADDKYRLDFFCYYEHGDGRERRMPYMSYIDLEQNGIVDLYLGKNREIVATLYNKKGRLYCIPYGKNVTLVSAKSDGEVVNGDEIQYNGLNIIIQFEDE